MTHKAVTELLHPGMVVVEITLVLLGQVQDDVGLRWYISRLIVLIGINLNFLVNFHRKQVKFITN